MEILNKFTRKIYKTYIPNKHAYKCEIYNCLHRTLSTI